MWGIVPLAAAAAQPRCLRGTQTCFTVCRRQQLRVITFSNQCAAAGRAAEGATAYVTLEPCNHFGRTPPCSQALVDAKVARVSGQLPLGVPQPIKGHVLCPIQPPTAPAAQPTAASGVQTRGRDTQLPCMLRWCRRMPSVLTTTPPTASPVPRHCHFSCAGMRHSGVRCHVDSAVCTLVNFFFTA
jgi:hypothetical protein